MVHLAPLTPAWPADLFGGGTNIDLKNARNRIQSRSYKVCAIYYHECAYIWRSRNALALGAYVYHGLATKVNNVLPVQIRKCMENVTPSCRLIADGKLVLIQHSLGVALSFFDQAIPGTNQPAADMKLK